MAKLKDEVLSSSAGIQLRISSFDYNMLLWMGVVRTKISYLACLNGEQYNLVILPDEPF